MPTATRLNLRALIREVLDASDASDPEDLAVEVLDRVDNVDTREALRQALAAMVRNEISFARMRHAPHDSHSAGAHPPEGRRPEEAARTLADRVRESWRRHLDDRLPGVGGWKRLKEFTVADLDYAATYRETLAAANTAMAERYRALLKAITQAGVTTVGELDEETLRGLLDD